MIKKIIVPTDFSENARVAAKFACQLAQEQDYQIHLLHCYNSETSIFDEKLNVKEPITEIMRGDFLMEEWRDSLQIEFPNIIIDGKCTLGLITDVIPKIAIQPNFSLIILGSNGLGKDDSPMFGSTTSQIATESHIPVIAIPSNFEKKAKLSRVAILTNFKNDELESLHDFTQLLNTPDEIDIIHVYQNSDNLNEVEKNIKDWAEKVEKIIPTAHVNCLLKPINYSDNKEDTIPEVINITIKENHYDIVIVTKSRKSFFDKWFARSISKEVILKLKTSIFFDNN